MLIGLNKLTKGADDVERMKVTLREDESRLKEAEEATNRMLGSLEVSSLEAKRENEKVERIASACKQETDRIAQEKADAEEDLAKAKVRAAGASMAR